MSIFRCPKTMPVPETYTADDIKIESSTCTGMRTIGFYDRSAKKLVYWQARSLWMKAPSGFQEARARNSDVITNALRTAPKMVKLKNKWSISGHGHLYNKKQNEETTILSCFLAVSSVDTERFRLAMGREKEFAFQIN